MPDTLSDADLWTIAITVPLDGDVEAAASVITGFQGLANRTTNVRKGVQGVASSLTARIPLVPVFNSSSIFVFNTASSGSGWIQSSLAASDFRFMLPHHIVGKLDQVIAHVSGGTPGQHAGLPTGKPNVSLFSVDLTTVTGTTTNIGSANDASATLAAYEAAHTIAITGIAQTLSATSEYFIKFSGESGTNSLANAVRLLCLEVVYTP